jgi:HEPN domain-containing protein
MTTAVISLHRRFFQAAQIDLETGKLLIQANRLQPALYHFQQAYEKCVKSFYSLKEAVDNKTPESEIYKRLKSSLSHDTQKSTLQLLRDIVDRQKRDAEKAVCDLQEKQAENPLNNTVDPNRIKILQQLVSVTAGFLTTLDGMMNSFDLENKYIENVKKYEQFVKKLYDTFQFSNTDIIAKQPEQAFLQIVVGMVTLYPCFFRMENITRYPLLEFQYENLDLLANQKQACREINEMLGDLFAILTPYLSEYQPDSASLSQA